MLYYVILCYICDANVRIPPKRRSLAEDAAPPRTPPHAPAPIMQTAVVDLRSECQRRSIYGQRASTCLIYGYYGQRATGGPSTVSVPALRSFDLRLLRSACQRRSIYGQRASAHLIYGYYGQRASGGPSTVSVPALV
eukprot:561561-Pyramimonas_sp.AAC.1